MHEALLAQCAVCWRNTQRALRLERFAPGVAHHAESDAGPIDLWPKATIPSQNGVLAVDLDGWSELFYHSFTAASILSFFLAWVHGGITKSIIYLQGPGCKWHIYRVMRPLWYCLRRLRDQGRLSRPLKHRCEDIAVPSSRGMVKTEHLQRLAMGWDGYPPIGSSDNSPSFPLAAV